MPDTTVMAWPCHGVHRPEKSDKGGCDRSWKRWLPRLRNTNVVRYGLSGLPDRVGNSKEFDRVEHKMEDVRQMLIQRGLQTRHYSLADFGRLRTTGPQAERNKGNCGLAGQRKVQEMIVAWKRAVKTSTSPRASIPITHGPAAT